MLIFVSYAFEDKAHFENITDALDAAGLEYWKTGETRAGEMLSKQLQDAISRSVLCIFIATRNSVASSWCNAELGAFWGSAKRVLIYIADDNLTEAELPRQFQGHFLQRRIKGLVKDCQQYLKEIRADQEAHVVSAGDVTLRGVSRDELVGLIEDAVFRSSSNSLAISAFLDLEAKPLPIGDAQVSEDGQRQIQQALTAFLGLTRPSVDDNAARRWPHAISVQTSTGDWRGYAQTANWRSYNYVHTPCLLFKYDDKFRVDSVVLCRWYVEFDRGGEALQGVLAAVGKSEIGSVVSPQQ